MVQRTPPDTTARCEATTRRHAPASGVRVKRSEAAGDAPDPRLYEGARVRDLELVRPIGTGATGAVWLARSVGQGQVVAVKFLTACCDDESGAAVRERFFLEAKLTAHLCRRTPHVIANLDLGIHHGLPYLVMELGEAIPEAGMAPREIARLVTHVGRALEATHAARIVHRDVKPANILRTSPRDRKTEPSTVYKLADYGIASTLDGRKRPAPVHESSDIVLIGTLAYMSPDLVCGQPADVASDLWALGVTAYQLVTGRLPFTASSWFTLATQVAEGDFDAIGVKTARRFPLLEHFFRRSFHPRGARFRTASELARDFAAALAPVRRSDGQTTRS